MRVKLLLMFKNEGHLLKSWIKYHSRLVGYKNLVIFDNGSTCDETIEVIDWAERHSILIDRSFSSQDDFVTRGDLFKDIINEKTYRFRADFYLPVDCDEFLAVENGGRISISRSAIQSELSKFKNAKRALAIQAGLDNDPNRHGQFVWSPDQLKKFFTPGNCLYLDHGFHCGLGMHGDEAIKTKIIYIHYHFKPYHLLLQHAKEKLRPYLSDFSIESLEQYIADERPAYHCAYHLLKSEADYAHQFEASSSAPFPEVEAAFRRVGENLPFDDRPTDKARSLSRTSTADGLWRSLITSFKSSP